MVPLIEDYLTIELESRFNYLRANPLEIYKIIQASDTKLDKLRNFLLRTPIKIIRGFPRTPADLPCISILLSGEEETQSGLGDTAEEEEEDVVKTFTEQLLVTVGDASIHPYISLTKKSIITIQQLHNDSTDSVLSENKYNFVSSPYGDILEILDDTIEEDSPLTATYSYQAVAGADMEYLYESNYRLEVWTNNGDLTVEIYQLLKWALLDSRSSLVTTIGLFRQKLGGSDFEPSPSWMPEFVYRRAITLWCQFNVRIPTQDTFYISEIEVDQTINFST